MKNEVFTWAIRLWLIATVGFTLFCVGRGLNHFPKHEKQVEVILPARVDVHEVEVHEAFKTAGNSYEIIRRAK